MARRSTKPNWTKKIALSLGLMMSATVLTGASDHRANFEERILAAHNRERGDLNVPPMRWNNALAADAAKWASHLVRVGHLVHYKEAPDDWDPQGENLWAGTKGYYSPEAMVGLWIAEKRNYRPGIFPANSRTGNLEDVGHYTQLIWRSSREVGCAIARGGQDDFLVCRYAEGGNVIGERPV